MKRLIASTLCVLAFSGQVDAGFISVVGNLRDGQIGANGEIAGGSDPSDRTGTGGNDSRGLALIYFFELPILGPGVTITNAEIEFDYVEKTSSPEFNIDLYGLDARANANIQLTDYYDGPATSNTDDVLIQTAIITPSTSLGNLSISNSSLLNFVNSLYNVGGTPIDTFSTFRVNPDKDLPSFSSPIRGYFMALADHPTESFRPRLNLTTVPEPSSLILFGIGAVGLFGYGWRKRKSA